MEWLGLTGKPTRLLEERKRGSSSDFARRGMCGERIVNGAAIDSSISMTPNCRATRFESRISSSASQVKFAQMVLHRGHSLSCFVPTLRPLSRNDKGCS